MIPGLHGYFHGRGPRRIAASKLVIPKSIENRYVAELKRILQAVHKHYRDNLELREDAYNKHSAKLDHLGVQVIAAIRKPTKKAFDKMAAGVEKANRQALKGISPSDVRLSGQIAAFRDRNVRLMEDAARTYAQQVRDVLEDPDAMGRSVDDLADDIEERASVSESKAELIARDQTLKLNGQINEIRQTNAGIDQYTWSTSQDERVRESHRDLEGQVFDWDSPPEVGHPGEDYQCRCVAIPVIPGLDTPDNE